MSCANRFNFADAVLRWYDEYGRKDLPWQRQPTTYRVWISEIMLQQTRVGTVVGYYERFMRRFPSLVDLADAPLDDVLELWSGLGYYARAHNLHSAAKVAVERFGGELPEIFNQLPALPGIGRSTAGAILALACKQRHPILDGNVKRVLARYFAVEGWPGKPRTANTLWAHAEQLTPHNRIDHYTQAIMDIGATLCTRGKPNCGSCPLRARCRALKQDSVAEIPARKPKKSLSVRHRHMLLLQNERGQVLLEKRPPSGIWGGLLGLPMFDNAEQLQIWLENRSGAVKHITDWPLIRHTFSHFHMDITPVHCRIITPVQAVMEATGQVWYKDGKPPGGLAAPVSRLLQQLFDESKTDGSTLP